MKDTRIKSGGAAAAVATLIVFVAAMFGLPVPPGVEGAIATLVGFGVAAVKR